MRCLLSIFPRYDKQSNTTWHPAETVVMEFFFTAKNVCTFYGFTIRKQRFILETVSIKGLNFVIT